MLPTFKFLFASAYSHAHPLPNLFLPVSENCFLEDYSEIRVNGNVVRPKKEFVYLKFYKPIGFESTLNTSIETNLSSFFKEYEGLAIAGRLDKQSEGLLVLSNDGKWVERMCNPKFEKEKEYLVTLDKEPDSDFLISFQKGVKIGKHVTAPCSCSVIGQNQLTIVLKEGKNRQIRRMCKVLGYDVIILKRVRIDDIFLNDLASGTSKILLEINKLLQNK